jgi:hypothetical protein
VLNLCAWFLLLRIFHFQVVLFWVNFMLPDNAGSRVAHIGPLARSACLWLLCASFCGCFLKALFSFPFFLCVLNDPIFFSIAQVVSFGLDQRKVMVFL